MTYDTLTAPTLTDFEVMARAALADMPAELRDRLGRLVIRVEDFASPDILREMSLSDPFELTGLYDGTALVHQSTMDLPTPPPAVWLFRRPILDEWAHRGDVELRQLIAHVLVHEVAHHFGYTDEEIAAIDDWRL